MQIGIFINQMRSPWFGLFKMTSSGQWCTWNKVGHKLVIYQRQAISTCYLIILLFWLSSFKKCIYFTCMSVLLTHCLRNVCVLTAVEVRRGRWIPWNWRLWVTIWVLGIELRPLKEPQVLLIIELSLFLLCYFQCFPPYWRSNTKMPENLLCSL